MAQAVVGLPSKYEALGSTTITMKKEKERNCCIIPSSCKQALTYSNLKTNATKNGGTLL
jgi:hypothetical protein